MTPPPIPEGFWRLVVNSSPDTVVAVNRKGSIIFANPRIRALLGWEPTEVLGKPLEILVPENFREAHVRHHTALPDSIPGRPMGDGRLLQARGKNGEIIEVEIGLSSIRLADEPVFLAYLRPVTPQRHLENACHSIFKETALLTGTPFFEALALALARSTESDFAWISLCPKDSEDRLRTLALCRDGKLLPPIEYSTIGTPCAETLKGNEVNIPENVQVAYPEDKFLSESAVAAYIAIPLRAKSGEILGNIGLMHRAPRPNQEAAPVILRLFAMRAAGELDRWFAEEALRLEEQARKSVEHCQKVLLEAAFVLSSKNKVEEIVKGVLETICLGLGWKMGALWEIDPSSEMLRVRELYLSPEMAQGNEFSEITKNSSFTKGAGLPGRVWASGEPAWIEDVQADGNFPRAPQASNSNIRTGFAIPVVCSGATRGVLEFFREKKGEIEPRMLEILKVLGIQLGHCLELEKSRVSFLHSQKMEVVGQLAGGVAHDFNNILTAIVGYCDLLLPSFPPEDSRGQDIREIRESGGRAARLTSQLLAFSRRSVVQPIALEISEVVRDLGGMLRRIVRESIEIKYIHGRLPARVLIDKGQIEQVVLNLAVNASDAIAGFGTIEIYTGAPPPGVDGHRHDEMGARGLRCVLAIRDTGPGIDKNCLDKIFEPFFTTKPPGKGTGLGLSTVQGIVNQAGGAVVVDSTPGKGATFSIYLPLTDRARTEPISDHAPRLGGTETILVVEDEGQVRRIVCRTLSSLGYNTIQASSPSEALDLLKGETRVKLLLTDLVMPGMTGLDLALASRKIHPGLKILLMSGYAAPLLNAHPENPIFNQPILEKPFSKDSLAESVRRALDADKAE